MAITCSCRSTEGGCYCKAFAALATAFENNEQLMPVPVTELCEKSNWSTRHLVKDLVKDLDSRREGETEQALQAV